MGRFAANAAWLPRRHHPNLLRASGSLLKKPRYSKARGATLRLD